MDARLQPPPRRRVTVATLVIVAFAVLALAIAHVSRRHAVIRRGYELMAQTEELRRLEEENRRLRLERSMLRHPDRIERRAYALGMARPNPSQIRAAPEIVLAAQ